MKEMYRSETVVSEAAVLVGVVLPTHRFPGEPLDELEGLAQSAGRRVVGQLTQRRETPDKTTYLGKGKVDELRLLVDATDADVVIFDNDLTPAQTRNLEKATGTKVLDRTELILDIFASRAQTHEARLAVELAQLQYSLPRLKRMWTHLSRLKMGIGMRGPGEKQLEVDRRLVEKRIHDLRTRAVDDRAPQGAPGRRPARSHDGLAGRLHQCRQKHAVERPDRRRRAGRAQAIRHARHAHAPLAIAWLGTGAPERHGRIHSRSASPFDRQLQSHARRGAAGRPAAARRRCQQPGRVISRSPPCTRCSRNWASRRKTRCWC